MVALLTVAALCLIFSLFQALVALKLPEFPWNKWGAGLSLLTAIYAVAVFLQYNLAQEPANIVCARVQYTIFPLLVHALFGFTAAFLSIASHRRHKVLLIWHAALLGLLWSTDLIVGDTFVTRHFLWRDTPYIEPATGPRGLFYLLYALGVALYVLSIWLKPLYRGHAGRTGFRILPRPSGRRKKRHGSKISFARPRKWNPSAPWRRPALTWPRKHPAGTCCPAAMSV